MQMVYSLRSQFLMWLSASRRRCLNSFVDSIGVNTHLSYLNSPYNSQFSTLQSRLVSAGIRHVRDSAGLSGTGAAHAASLANVGIKFNLVQDASCNNTYNIEAPASGSLSWVTAAQIDTFEGPNELDLYSCNGPPWYTQDKTYAAKIASAVRGNATLTSAGVKIIAPSLGSINNSVDATNLGSMAPYADYGCLHDYPDGNYPSAGLAAAAASTAPENAGMQPITTETGYDTDTTQHGATNQPGIDLQTHGKYFSRLFFENFNFGKKRTYAYELMDDNALSGTEATYGLLTSNGSPKPGFTAISNEIALLSDVGSSFIPRSLIYSLGSPPSQIHHTLLQKRNGRFYLVLWQEVLSYNNVNTPYGDLSIVPVNLTVTFPVPITTVNQYDPIASASPLQTKSNVSILNVSVLDQALILEIIP